MKWIKTSFEFDVDTQKVIQIKPRIEIFHLETYLDRSINKYVYFDRDAYIKYTDPDTDVNNTPGLGTIIFVAN